MENKFLSLIAVAILSVLPVQGQSYSVRDSILLIPSGVKKIEARAFQDRLDFNGVEFLTPCAVSEIGDYAFLGCSNLVCLTLPSSVRNIGMGAFRECEKLRKVKLTKNLTKIPKYAFAWCPTLESVTGASELTDIGSHSFAYCSALTGFYFPPTLDHIGSNAFSCCGSLSEVSLPYSIKELESYAFSECLALKKAILPQNSNLLGELIFSGCRNLEEIYELSPIPPKFDCESTLFEQTEPQMYQKCRLIVCPGREEIFQNAPGWKLFSSITPELNN